MTNLSVHVEFRRSPESNDAPVEGVLTMPDGTATEFSGWMALLGLLEEVAGAPVAVVGGGV